MEPQNSAPAPTIINYRDLHVWQRSMDLVVIVCRLTDNFPARELYALSNQMRRAAYSIPSNIAEGHGRRSDREFAHFLRIANGSLREVETQTLIAQRLEYIDQRSTDEVLEQAGLVGRLIAGLLNKMKT